MAQPSHRTSRRGFTLVELLTVIAIIAILIAILMPTLTRVRDNARLVQCQSNLRTIYMAAQLHANDHQGYLPASGWHWDPLGGVVNPHGLGDDRARRYIYYNDAGVQRPVPITVALAVSLGVKVRLDSRQGLEADMQSETIRK